MYERFTDRARKVMQLANQETMRFNHDFIGTEHVLIGLLKEDSGVAAQVLKSMKVDFQKLKEEIVNRSKPGPETSVHAKLPMSPSVKKVIEFAMEASRNLNHNYVGTEHLLLGLLRPQENSMALHILESFGLKFEVVKSEIQDLLGVQYENVTPAGSQNEPGQLQLALIAMASGKWVRLFNGKIETRDE